jgi:hypothetical protein
MTTISDNDDPREAVEGMIELTDTGMQVAKAVIGAVEKKLSHPQSKDIPSLDNPDPLPEKPVLKDSELVPALLEKVPENLRDTVTIQVGSSKVFKPGGEINLKPSQAKTLRTLLDDPSKTSGIIKMYDNQGSNFLKVSGGEVHYDNLEILPKQTVEQIAPPSLSVAPEASTIGPEVPIVESSSAPKVEPIVPEAATLQPEAPPLNSAVDEVKQAIAPGVDQQALIDTIARLETRVQELEQKISQKPFKLANVRVSNWLNGIRDNIAAQLHQTTDKISQRVHDVADKISVTTTEKVNEIKDSVTEKVDDVKQNVAGAVSDVRENVADNLTLARDLTVSTVNEVIDAGMERHNEAIAKINENTQNVVSGVRQAVNDPRQSYIEKFATPVVQRFFEAAERIPNRVTTDEQGNRNLKVGTHDYQLSKSGEMTVKRSGEKMTAETLTSGDVAAIMELRQIVPPPKQTEQMKQAQKIEAPKPKIKV